MTFKPSLKTEVEKAQMAIDDAIEAMSVLDNAIACGFLKDEHSLIVQTWIKEYQLEIEQARNFLDNVGEKAWVMMDNGKHWLLVSN